MAHYSNAQKEPSTSRHHNAKNRTTTNMQNYVFIAMNDSLAYK